MSFYKTILSDQVSLEDTSRSSFDAVWKSIIWILFFLFSINIFVGLTELSFPWLKFQLQFRIIQCALALWDISGIGRYLWNNIFSFWGIFLQNYFFEQLRLMMIIWTLLKFRCKLKVVALNGLDLFFTFSIFS